MLSELRIRNLAIIDTIALRLEPGFNVLSGETGAGKSIIVEALGLLLGDRASAELVRSGADRAVVEGVFEIDAAPDLLALLEQRGVELEDGLLVIKREIAASGRARAWVNNGPATAGLLAELGRHLVNLHGQHDAQSLLDADSQRRMLDAFAGAAAQAQRVGEAAAHVAELRKEREELAARRADAERRADYLRHVVREIEAATLRPGEDQQLEDEARRLENADELRSLARGIRDAIRDADHAVLERLGQVQRSLSQLERLDPTLHRLQEIFDAAYYSLDSLSVELEQYEESVELDPERLAAVQQRRELLFRLVRKHGPTLEAVIEAGERARQELHLVEGGELDLRALASREQEATEYLHAVAAELTRLRTAAAGALSRQVEDLLPQLGMPDGRFAVRIEPLAAPNATGAETVEFHVTLNRGHEPRSLARVASGGELSRVMLALRTILAQLESVPTLVFDEVDAGIGGTVALRVGDTLRQVAAHHQVFAITHLAQIAARAHHHIVVEKGAPGGVTTADIRVVTGEDRVREIARMLGGDPERPVSRAHATELLQGADGSGVAAPAASAVQSGPGKRAAPRRR